MYLFYNKNMIRFSLDKCETENWDSTNIEEWQDKILMVKIDCHLNRSCLFIRFLLLSYIISS